MGLPRIRECSSGSASKGRLLPAVVANVTPKPGTERRHTVCASAGEYRKSSGNGSRALTGALGRHADRNTADRMQAGIAQSAFLHVH